MTSSNDVTGARLVTKPVTEEYSSGWDRIFGNKEKTHYVEEQEDNGCGCFHYTAGCCGSSGTKGD